MAALCVGLGVCVSACDQLTTSPLQHEAYVWQRTWNPSVSDAIERSKPFLVGWRLLLAEASGADDWREFSPIVPKIDQDEKTLTAVVRIDGQGNLIDPAIFVDRLMHLMRARASIRWAAVEIDYDCPSSSLDAYAEFVREVRRRMPPETRVSITALPTWIGARSIKNLLDAADESVLQVHSVLDPHRGLFDVQSADRWLSAYAPLTKKPFRVALPDYGSRVGWDSAGRIASIVSEQSTPQDNPNEREVLAKVRDVNEFLSKVRQRHPVNLVGIVWFRLPVAGDQRIWSIPTLAAVVQGLRIVDRRSLHVERDRLGAYQIEVMNGGSIDAPLPSAVQSSPCIAADGFGGYSVEHAADHLSFVRQDVSIMRPGQRLIIGWTRCAVRQEELTLEDE
jgi:hypothetical protein